MIENMAQEWHMWMANTRRSSRTEKGHAMGGTKRHGHDAVEKGIGLGAVVAVTASWSVNQSVLWAIAHGVLSWIYVIYYVVAY
jgi:hypothetical protein